MQIIIDKENLIKMFAITLHAISEGSLYDVAKDTATELVEVIGYTPLPKGHGRLIDADKFHRTLEDMPIRDNDKWFNWLQKACNRLAEAPTIIEADKEGDSNVK